MQYPIQYKHLRGCLSLILSIVKPVVKATLHQTVAAYIYIVQSHTLLFPLTFSLLPQTIIPPGTSLASLSPSRWSGSSVAPFFSSSCVHVFPISLSLCMTVFKHFPRESPLFTVGREPVFPAHVADRFNSRNTEKNNTKGVFSFDLFLFTFDA